MTSLRIRQDIIAKLAALSEMSPDVRIGQLLANLGFLSEDMFNQNLWDIDDEQFLQVIDRHRAELSSRQSNVA